MSSVLWLDYKGVSALFTGDAPFATEEKLLRDDRLGLLTPLGVTLSETEILKVSHHGSADSTSLAFLEYLQTETAILSYGKNNLYGHPSKEVCENLERADVTAYSTEGCGAVVITIEPSGKYTVDFVK